MFSAISTLSVEMGSYRLLLFFHKE